MSGLSLGSIEYSMSYGFPVLTAEAPIGGTHSGDSGSPVLVFSARPGVFAGVHVGVSNTTGRQITALVTRDEIEKVISYKPQSLQLADLYLQAPQVLSVVPAPAPLNVPRKTGLVASPLQQSVAPTTAPAALGVFTYKGETFSPAAINAAKYVRPPREVPYNPHLAPYVATFFPSSPESIFLTLDQALNGYGKLERLETGTSPAYPFNCSRLPAEFEWLNHEPGYKKPKTKADLFDPDLLARGVLVLKPWALKVIRYQWAHPHTLVCCAFPKDETLSIVDRSEDEIRVKDTRYVYTVPPAVS